MNNNNLLKEKRNIIFESHKSIFTKSSSRENYFAWIQIKEMNQLLKQIRDNSSRKSLFCPRTGNRNTRNLTGSNAIKLNAIRETWKPPGQAPF